MSYEQTSDAFPLLVPGLVSQEWISFVMVRSQAYGPIVIGAKGTYYLRHDRYEGENLLANFGPHAPTI